MFLLMMEIMLANCLCNFLVFQVERECFLREYSNKMYSLTPYYLTKCVLEFPLLLLTPLMMELILFWGCEFTPGYRAFFMQYITLFMLSHCAAALGYIVSAVSKNFIDAAIIGQAIVIPMTLFGGLLVQMNTTFVWIRWVQWFTPVRYAF